MHCRRLLLPLIAVLSPLAHAQNVVSEQSLGAAKGVLDFCSRIDREDASGFSRQAVSLVKGIGPEQLKQMRAGAEYRRSYQALTALLDGMPLADALKQCRHVVGDEAEHG